MPYYTVNKGQNQNLKSAFSKCMGQLLNYNTVLLGFLEKKKKQQQYRKHCPHEIYGLVKKDLYEYTSIIIKR